MSTSNNKQKNLFSFFSKKAPSPSLASAPLSKSSSSSAANPASATDVAVDATAARKTKGDISSRASSSSSSSSAAHRKLLSEITVGTRLAVYWPDDDEHYPCTIRAHRPRRGQDPGHLYELHYEDGEVETIDLARERFRVIGGKKKKKKKNEEKGRSSNDDGGDGKEKDDDIDVDAAAGSSAKKRRRILQESSEEDEFDELDGDESEEEDDDDDSGSEYQIGAGEDSADDSLNAVSEKDDWMESEEEEEEDAPKKNKKRAVVRKITVARTDKGGAATDGERFVSPTPMKSSKGEAETRKAVVKDIDFSSFLSQSPSEGGDSRPAASAPSSVKAVTQSQNSPIVTNDGKGQAGKKSPPPTTTTTTGTVPKPVPGAVNQAGSHTHNHLKFFTSDRRDANRNPAHHPCFSPRTLFVDHNELARHQESGKVTAAQRQWWDIKSQYADTVLLFKTGKFYEMFHDDADVGVSVLGFVYMKGTAAHAGFPEGAYGTMVSRLVQAGYKVARVEQTETPDALQERKKRMPKGHKKPEVVCREVCSVVSKGTRTFCYLDDVRLLESGEACTGPLVVIKETLVEDGPGNKDGMDVDVDDGEAGTKAICEYGVTIVDAVTGVVTLGQFADDVLRSRMQTLLARFGPSEVLYEGGHNGASKTLINFLKSACPPNTVIDCINPKEKFPKSTAVDADVRRMLDRSNVDVKPWDVNEALGELHRKGYYPRSSRNAAASSDVTAGISRWPEILRCCIEGGATLALSSFGAALFYLQRGLVDAEILSLGIFKAYAPPNTSETANCNTSDSSNAYNAGNPSNYFQEMFDKDAQGVAGIDLVGQERKQPAADDSVTYAAEASIDHMALDGTTLSNLEILHNITSGSYQGSLLSKIDATESPHGSRLLRAWLLRPLFRKEDICRRADVVEELAGGSAAMAMSGARALLKKTGDIERLLSRVHSMGGGGGVENIEQDGAAAYHPDERAVLYETDKHNKRKVGDFSKLLNGLRAAADIPELFQNINIRSPMLQKIVRTTDEGGCFPSDMKDKLDWFFDNFDLERAARGDFEPCRGMDDDYDAACDAIEDVKRDLEAYKEEMCSSVLQPKSVARSSWKYINTKEDAKDKYLIELPATLNVPNDFYVKAKRGNGPKQVNKYRTPFVEELVQVLERAINVKNAGKAAGMKRVFAKFASMRSVWMAAVQASAMLDALGSLAHIAIQPGYSRPFIVDCLPPAKPGIEIIQGRHPCVDTTHSGADFIPNDLVLGSRLESDDTGSEPSVLLLSGPNMGGKSTLLRQTCLIAILAQIGSFVPAERCTLTPVDRIFTRLGASDRILCGQSTFFVELAETAAAARGATRRSLVIMDELGRGTSTFDGTAIASATVKHLVERNKCLTLFATHYHSLLEDWKNEESIKLGHMECIVEDDNEEAPERKHNITFLYTLGDGPCPKSFGVNVARLAGLPDDVLQKAKAVSSLFEAEINGQTGQHNIIPSTAGALVDEIKGLLLENGVENCDRWTKLWRSLQ